MKRIIKFMIFALLALPSMAEVQLIPVCDGSASSQFVPVYSYWSDEPGVESQVIYPSSKLKLAAGGVKQIKSITFYCVGEDKVPASLGEATVIVRMGETYSTTISTRSEMVSNRNGMEIVYQGSLPTGSNEMTITLQTPYVYQGNNLMIDIYIEEPSENCARCYWVGELQEETTAWNNKNGGELFLPKMTVAVDDYQEQVLDFGKITKGTSTTATVTVENASSLTLETEAPFSIESIEGNVVTIKFAPTDATSYTRNLTVKDGQNVVNTIRLKGIGTGGTNDGPVATRDEGFFKDIKYNWTDSEGTAHTSNLSETATDPDQMIAMLKEVYTNKTIPGNLFRSNAKASTDLYNDVLYTGVGQIAKGPSIGYATNQVLDIAQYASITTAGATVTGMSTIYKYANSWLTLSTYGAMQADGNQNWLETSSLTGYSTTWSATDIFQGYSAYFTSSSNSKIIYGSGSQTFYVTNCVQVKAYTSNTNGYSATLRIYECTFSADGTLTASSTAFDTKSGRGVLTSADLDQSKIYKVQLAGGGTYPDLYEIGFKAGTLVNDYSNTNEYIYVNSYGWDIPGDIEGSGDTHYFADYQYQPYDEGVTLLLVEMVDDFAPNKNGVGGDPTHDYAKLRGYFAESMKSVRVVTEAKRTGTGEAAGTLFKIDCDKMNNFFLLAKGQLQWFTPTKVNSSYTARNNPYLAGTTYADYGLSSSYLDKEPALFCHMFEQFSPSATVNAGSGETSVNPNDLYQAMINMTTFGVDHDCPNVPYCNGEGHGFKMYNSDYSGDCADVRDMMFFVPDYRMMEWTDRGDPKNTSYTTNRTHDYFRYNTSHAPTMGLYVITQDTITGQQVGSNEVYKLTLTWDSNLDKFLPSDPQLYQLFQVVVNEDGVEEYIPVYYTKVENGKVVYTDANGTTLPEGADPVPVELTLNPSDPKTYADVYIPMQESSQQVTFAVRGQDATQFLDLKTSNTQDFVIPGLDKNELVSLTDATHYSRFNPQTVKNCYSNKIAVANTAMGLEEGKIVNEGNNNATKLYLNRIYTNNVNGVSTTVRDTIATITFNPNNSTRQVKVQMAKQDAKTEFPVGKSTQTNGKYAGYHANNVNSNNYWTQSYSVKNGKVNFGELNIYDNFVVNVADNNHPNSYTYEMTSNYQGMPSMYLDVPATYDVDGAYWYAYAMKKNADGSDDTSVAQVWVKGLLLETKDNGDKRYVFYFDPVMNKISCVRMNPNASPSWSSVWSQTQDLNIVDGGTYKIKSWDGDQGKMGVDYASPAEGYTSTAHSNTFRVPVFKTDSKINNVYSIEEVDDDDEAATGDSFENDNLTFEEKLQYSSKKTILRYDVYRWKEAENRFIVDKVTGKDNEEEDLSPNGQADNQDGSYTTKMNADAGEDVEVPYGSTDKWASFVDDVPENEATAFAYIYAPVVETFTTGKTSDDAKKDRTDYNTYGGPLQNAAIGKLTLSVEEPVMSTYSWTKNGNKYAYYNILLNVDAKGIPAGYKIYKIRVWREVDESVLGEEYPELTAERVKPTYKFEEISYAETAKINKFWSEEGLKFGYDEATATVTGPEGQKTVTFPLGTFGARKVETGVFDSFIAGFFARIYFTREANIEALNSRDLTNDADGKYYMVEANCNYTVTPTSVVTAVNDISGAKEIVGVSYVNTIGQVSSTPWQGVNVVVTRYSDGSVSTQKMMK